ncbi:MAG TPA: Hpt domain-containing protein [Chroococcales cyanobacterium]|jgi:HPt (histidine-containing phosphotransfer) domain-containing protein
MNFSFDVERVMANVEGDLAFARELIAVFNEDAPRQLEELRDTLFEGDPEKVRNSAHSIKGAVGNFSKGDIWQTAFALECAGKSGDLSQGASLMADLQAQLDGLMAELSRFAQEENFS